MEMQGQQTLNSNKHHHSYPQQCDFSPLLCTIAEAGRESNQVNKEGIGIRVE